MARQDLRSDFAALMSCNETKMAWRNVSLVFCARPLVQLNCIYIEAAENTDTKRISGGERYAAVYNIDYNRCIFCGYCVEACPTDAITHGHGFELASYNTSTLVYRKEQMLVKLPEGGAPPSQKNPAPAGAEAKL